MDEETDQERVAAAGSIDPAAFALAAIGASREKSDALVAEQIELVRLQKEKLEKEKTSLDEEQRLQLSHLRLRRFGDYAKAAMEMAIAISIALVVAGFGTLIWQAHVAHGLVVEPFRAPPDFAARGLDGAVLS